ncbi:MAG: hypothetical protein KDA24_00925 [Deltaproteobacteria bacterium]|nr:hypothetical protein [Deltaproteobacteria bacterium]
MKRHQLLALLLLALPTLGNDDCGGVEAELPGDTEVDLPGGITDGAELSDLAGECAPASFLYCGNTVEGDTTDWNTGITDVIDGYPVSVGSYAGGEIAWAFRATVTETASFSLIDPEPTVINHDIFILEAGSEGTCQSADAVARGFNSIDFDVVAGNTYFVVLDSFEGEGGAFSAELSCTGEAGEVTPPPTADLPSTEVYFSPLAEEDSHLARTAELIDGAQSTLDIAMYSFSYTPMMDALQRAQDRGVSIRIMTFDSAKHRKSPEDTRSAALEDMGIEVRWVNKIQHHKFVIVDGPRDDLSKADDAWLVTGSGNWSWSAGTRYDENTVVVQGDEALVLSFQQEFDLLWDNSRDLVWNESIGHIDSAGVTDADIDAADSFAEPTFTSANMTTFVHSTHGPGFRTTSGSGAARNEIADVILSAEDSIWIASGHLRSRQIVDALTKAVDERPSLDVRVYLDGQEYTSTERHTVEVEKFDACMANASTPTQRNNCNDMGVHFGYDLAEANIPLRYKHYSYRWHYSYAVQMHHKYVIVDGTRVASGSYNFSNNAEHDTMENVVVYEAVDYPALVAGFVENFETIWVTGLDGRYDALLDEVSNGTGEIPLVYDSMALTHQQVKALKDAIAAACADIDTEDFRRFPRRHTTCAR